MKTTPAQTIINNTHKLCSKCKNVFLLSSFDKDATKSSGRTSSCKSCNKPTHESYYYSKVAPKAKTISTSKKKLLKQCPIIEVCRTLLEQFHRREASKRWRTKNKELGRIRNKGKKSKPIPPEKAKEYKQRQYKKLKSDPKKWLNHLLRVSLRNSVRYRTKSSSSYIKFSPDDLINHLESQFTKEMTWNNYGKRGWHIDHIKPISSFDMTNDEEILKCWSLSNLRPLWWIDNLRKGNKIS